MLQKRFFSIKFTLNIIVQFENLAKFKPYYFELQLKCLNLQFNLLFAKLKLTYDKTYTPNKSFMYFLDSEIIQMFLYCLEINSQLTNKLNKYETNATQATYWIKADQASAKKHSLTGFIRYFRF